MIAEVYEGILYFLYLTGGDEVLWIVLPLFIATIIMLVYFEKYKDERPGWNTYVANSLVFLFISFILLRYIYLLEGDLHSLINYLDKFIVSLFLLLMGVVLLFSNFTHILPEKIVKYVSSPLTLNLVAYILVLYVYSEMQNKWNAFLALSVLFFSLFLIFNAIRVFASKLLDSLKKMKNKEKKENVILEKGDIRKKKREVKREEIGIKEKKKSVEREEKRVVKEMLKKLNDQKKEAVKLKKLAKK